MALDAGARLGPYEIVAPLGAGGMGEVYRARDPRLGRDVAIKVSRAQFSARFEREARSTAALNHPNICHLYDVGPNYLVMELIDGMTLGERVRQGALPLEEALAIGKQIADALDAAHEKGIVHRDLKPANIKIRTDGTVKVLDFGLAKLADQSEPEVPASNITMTMDSETHAGMVVGTAAYMSPEQARGRTIDKRTDIWAFGVVLCEMLTGEKMFRGETLSEILIEVATHEPDLTGVPAKARRLLQRCLAKDPRKRLRDIGDAWDLLEEAPPSVTAATPAVKPRSAALPWAIAAVLLLAIGGLLLQLWRAGARTPTLLQATVDLSPSKNLGQFGHPSQTALAFSPDGNTLVFSGFNGTTRMLYRRSLNQSNPTPIAGTEDGTDPFFLSDGQWLGFATGTELRKMPVAGGPVVTICKLNNFFPFGVTWGTGGSIVYSETGELKEAPESGGEPRVRLAPKALQWLSSPEFLPDGKALLFTTVWNHNQSDPEVSVLPRGGSPHTVLKDAASPRYAGGYLFFMRRGSLFAVPFDRGKLAISGKPVAMLDGVMQAANTESVGTESGIGQFAVSRTGALVYAPGGIVPAPSSSLVKLDRKGAINDLNLHDVIDFVRLSPDGQRLAASRAEAGKAFPTDLVLYDLARGTSRLLAPDSVGMSPVWSPDGSKIAYSDWKSIFVLPVDGAGRRETLLTVKADQSVLPFGWSDDGRLSYHVEDDLGKNFIYIRPVAEAAESKLFREARPGQDAGFWDEEISPNGKWIAYESWEGGQTEIYVEALPDGGAKQRISTSGGENPTWSRNGRELFYVGPNSANQGVIMSVDVETGDRFRASIPHALFALQGLTGFNPTLRYDVYPDGQHFIASIRKQVPPAPVTHLNLVLNWLDEVKGRVAER